MANTVPHTITIGTQRTVVHIADVYANIGSLIGITKLADNTTIDAEASINDLVARGQVLKVRVGYKATNATRLKYAFIYIDRDNIANMSKVIGKDFKGGKINTVGFRRRRQLV